MHQEEKVNLGHSNVFHIHEVGNIEDLSKTTYDINEVGIV